MPTEQKNQGAVEAGVVSEETNFRPLADYVVRVGEKKIKIVSPIGNFPSALELVVDGAKVAELEPMMNARDALLALAWVNTVIDTLGHEKVGIEDAEFVQKLSDFVHGLYGAWTVGYSQIPEFQSWNERFTQTILSQLDYLDEKVSLLFTQLQGKKTRQENKVAQAVGGEHTSTNNTESSHDRMLALAEVLKIVEERHGELLQQLEQANPENKLPTKQLVQLINVIGTNMWPEDWQAVVAEASNELTERLKAIRHLLTLGKVHADVDRSNGALPQLSNQWRVLAEQYWNNKSVLSVSSQRGKDFWKELPDKLQRLHRKRRK